jgi:hypothetical protein
MTNAQNLMMNTLILMISGKGYHFFGVEKEQKR